jgi:hypothetical protein
MSSGAAPKGIAPAWIALALLLATSIGIAAGVLGWLSGQVGATVILTGAVAFGKAATLELLILQVILQAMRDQSPKS